jgi:peroxiredoxin
MALSVGTKAPDFSLSSKQEDGLKKVTLSENVAQGPVLVLFFPMAFTGVCTEELCSVTQGIEQYRKVGATVLAISGDNPFAQEAWAKKEGISLQILSDYEHKVAKSYDVAYDSFLPQVNLGMGGVAKRSAFVVGKDGVIKYAESNDDPKQLPNFTAILAAVESLK